MTLSELKALLQQLTASYFTGATVTYAKQSFVVKPTKPLVTLTLGAVSRPMNPPTKMIDGVPVCFYPSTVTVQIDLFTQGYQRESGAGYTAIYENTAEEDLLAFVAYLNSWYVVDWCHAHDISIVVPSTVQDLTGLIHDTNYEFRAMAEITVYYTATAIGYTGTLATSSAKHSGSGGSGGSGGGGTGGGDAGSGGGSSGTSTWTGDIQDDGVTITPEITQSPSGGGNPEMIGYETGYFENVAINDKLVKEED